MPKGPKGQKRPADAIGCAVMVARIATGEEEDTAYAVPNRAKSGRAGARARSDVLSAAERKDTARKAASERWKVS